MKEYIVEGRENITFVKNGPTIEKARTMMTLNEGEGEGSMAQMFNTATTHAIIKPDFDYYGDQIGIQEGTIRGNLYYYLLSAVDITQMRNKFDEGKYNSMLIPPISAIQSVLWMPYSDSLDYEYSVYTYDEKRFPVKGATDNEIELPSTVKRIHGLSKLANSIYGTATFKPFFNIRQANPSGFDWTREGKLFQYPFSYSVITDYINDPILIKPHLCKNAYYTSGLEDKLVVKQAVSNYGTNLLYVEGYKDDMAGLVEGSMTSKLRSLPLSVSAYSDYMASSQAQIEAQKKAAGQNRLMGGVGAVVAGAAVAGGILAAPFTGGLSLTAAAAGAGALASTGVGIMKSEMAYSQQIAQLAAQGKDYSNMPNRLTDGGSGDILFHNTVRDTSTSGLDIYGFCQPYDTMERIGWYFHLYGYAQKKVMRPNLRNRYHFNFIKTVGANISCKDGVGIPKHHFNTLKAIFDQGTTIYHIDRAGVHVGNLDIDNYEV